MQHAMRGHATLMNGVSGQRALGEGKEHLRTMGAMTGAIMMGHTKAQRVPTAESAPSAYAP